jgi:sterol desaturase/sphingolipid hydroxylase (fatty acid hydroxylase superfamily)
MLPNFMLLFAIPLFASMIIYEILLFRKNGRPFPYKEAGISLLMGSIYAVFNFRLAPYLNSFNEMFYQWRLITIPTHSIWGWILLFFALEFAYYWLHRCAHEIRWLWASHSVHHSPITMTFSGAYRLSLTGAVSGLFVFFIPLFVLGFSPADVSLMFALNLFYQFWLHTEWIPKLGWFEYIFNSPSHHRVHHATNPQYIDRNYGGILIIFDRMFGTFAEEKVGEPLNYGLIGKKPTLNPLRLFFQEWVAMTRDVWKAGRWRDRFYLTFGRPGWSNAISKSATGPKSEPHPSAVSQYKIG